MHVDLASDAARMKFTSVPGILGRLADPHPFQQSRANGVSCRDQVLYCGIATCFLRRSMTEARWAKTLRRRRESPINVLDMGVLWQHRRIGVPLWSAAASLAPLSEKPSDCCFLPPSHLVCCLRGVSAAAYRGTSAVVSTNVLHRTANETDPPATLGLQKPFGTHNEVKLKTIKVPPK